MSRDVDRALRQRRSAWTPPLEPILIAAGLIGFAWLAIAVHARSSLVVEDHEVTRSVVAHHSGVLTALAEGVSWFGSEVTVSAVAP